MTELTSDSSSHSMSLRDTAKGIGVRAAILGAGGLLVGGLLTAAVLKAAGTLVRIFLGLTVLMLGGGVAALEIHKVRKAWDDRETSGPVAPESP